MTIRSIFRVSVFSIGGAMLLGSLAFVPSTAQSAPTPQIPSAWELPADLD